VTPKYQHEHYAVAYTFISGYNDASLPVPAFALRELCGRMGPPILGAAIFAENRFCQIYSTFLQLILTENKNLQRNAVP